MQLVVMLLPAAPLAQSGEDREELDRLARPGSARLAERTRIVLARADGKDSKRAAAELRITEHTAAWWRAGSPGTASLTGSS